MKGLNKQQLKRLSMKRFKIIFLLFISVFINVNAQENKRMITGTITDSETGETLPGTSVIVKETIRGAVSNIDGQFTYLLQGSNVETMSLVVSFIGYETQEVLVGNKNYFDIALEPAYNSINEVVITSSYGTRKLKQEVVGSITSVKPQDLIVESAATSIDQLLEGQAAGVNIVASEGLDSPVKINIRGVGSLEGSASGTSTQPLIIIDGVILAEEVTIEGNNFFDASSGGFGEDFSNPLSKLGITDIESINILKDAAAVSLYGADGANGVILITTKGGEKGKPRFNFSAQSGITTEMDAIMYMNGEQYTEMQNLYYINKGDVESVQEWNGTDTDWHGALNQNSIYQRYNLSMSGGVKNLTYRASLGFQDTKEAQIGNEMQRYNGSISLGYRTDKLNLSIKASPSYSVRNTPNTLADYALPPNIAIYDDEENGVYHPFAFYGNPVAVANQNVNDTETFGLLTSINAGYKITPELQVSTLFGVDYSNKDMLKFFSGENQSGIDNSDKGEVVYRNRLSNRWNWNANINYNKEFAGGNHFDALLGIETRKSTSEQSYARGLGFEIYDTPQPVEDASEEDYEDDSSESAGRSGFTQFNYDFQKKYFVLVNARVDQSSSFGGDNNTSLNGGIGLSWVLSNEDFMKDLNLIKFMRLKTSYGTSGNSRIGSYKALGIYNNDDEGNDGYNGGNGHATPSSAPNPDLGWEKNKKFNVGLDMDFAFGLNMTVEYFYDNITDMIVSRDAPPETGYTTIQMNGADMYNQGIELALNSTVLDYNNFKWKVGFNISTVKNKVTDLALLGSESSASYSSTEEKIGYSASTVWGYEFVGIDPATGREIYYVDGRYMDAETLKSDYDDSSYRTPIGNTQPKAYGGMSNRFTIYKNLSISANLSYEIGSYKMVESTLIDNYVAMGAGDAGRNMSVNAYYSAWREPGDNATYAMVNVNPPVGNSSKYLYNTSHIKLNNVNISYRVPTSKVDWLNNLQFTATCSNVYYWFFEKSPEGQNGIKEFYRTSPEMRTYTFGVKASF